MKRKRYLFFDIDGTLLAGGYENTYIPQSTVTALNKCREAGHFLCIATGRLQAMAVDCMHGLGFTNMVSDGGYGVRSSGLLTSANLSECLGRCRSTIQSSAPRRTAVSKSLPATPI